MIGFVDPLSMRESDEGLYVKGQLDLEDSEVGREAWRSMKNNAVSLSFGYVVTKAQDRADGVRELEGIDLFEISVVPHPANPDTRFLSLKSATAPAFSDQDYAAIFDGFLIPDRSEAYAEFKAGYERRKQTKARNERPISIATFEVGCASYSDSPAALVYGPRLTKAMHCPWFLNCGKLRQPPFLHWSFEMKTAGASMTVMSPVKIAVFGEIGAGQTSGGPLTGTNAIVSLPSPGVPLSDT